MTAPREPLSAWVDDADGFRCLDIGACLKAVVWRETDEYNGQHFEYWCWYVVGNEDPSSCGAKDTEADAKIAAERWLAEHP